MPQVWDRAAPRANAPLSPLEQPAPDVVLLNLGQNDHGFPASKGQAIADKPYTFRAHPRVLSILRRHVDVVSLANNHSGDFGRAAFAEMLQRLDAIGLPHIGGGRDLASAHEPHIVQRNGLKIALLGYDEFFPRHFEAGHDHPGVAWSEDVRVQDDIRRARQDHHADVVLLFMHWGWENELVANARQRQLARLAIDAGADGVLGGHPHVTQDIEIYKGKPIVYSLGNFVFDGFESEALRTGWLLRLTVDKGGEGPPSKRPVQAIALKASGETELTPEGMHVMLLQTRQPLAAGERFTCAASFRKAGSLEVPVEVRAGP